MDDAGGAAGRELALSRRALDAGDLRHAAAHLAAALQHAPTRPEAHELLARLAARADDPLALFPVGEPASVGAVVARAHLLASRGRPDDGLELLAAATCHQPTGDWAGVPWVTDPALAAGLDPDRLTRAVLQICAATGDPVPEPDRPALRPYLTLLRHAGAAHPDDGLLLGAGSALARRLGETDLAVRWARQAVRSAPSKLTEVWLGYAYRSAGRTRRALAALRRAVAHDPDDLSVYADIADTLAERGRYSAALAWTARALARDATDGCAVHAGHRLRYLRDRQLRHLVALADFRSGHPERRHEHTELADCCRDQAWLAQLPPAGEAVVNVLRHVLATGRPVGGGQLQLSALESPSAMRALHARVPDVAVTVDDIPEPDIRQPRRAEGWALWHYDGIDARPALPPPSAPAADRLRELAVPAWPHPPAAYDAAVALATVDLADLLAVLVHPPAEPATELGRTLAAHDPALWVRCVQVWACLGLLHHRTQEPWLTSTRRRVLLELVWGVEDWVTEAALFALVTAAWVDPAVRADVAAVVAERLADVAAVARRRPVTIAWSVAQLALATPDLDPRSARLARRMAGARHARTRPVGAGPAALRPGSAARRVRRLVNWLTRGR